MSAESYFMSEVISLLTIDRLFPVTSLIIITLTCLSLYYYNRKSSKKNKQLVSEIEALKASNLELQRELEEVKNKAEESDKLKSSFLANMSHEIRTPLNAIMGFSSLLQSIGDDDKEFQQYIEIIHNNSNKLLDMMDEIFNIALIESGITSLFKEECQVNELITSLVTFFNLEKDISGKNEVSIRIKKMTRDSSFSIVTDPRKLRQTLYNLIENALKYTSEGSVEVGYDLKENNLVEFYVKDTGAGFPQEKLDIIFKQFRQVDESNTRNYGGIGLGLTLSQKFVEMMGGEMRGESSPGNGSTFYFTIPYQPVNQEKIGFKEAIQ